MTTRRTKVEEAPTVVEAHTAFRVPRCPWNFDRPLHVRRLDVFSGSNAAWLMEHYAEHFRPYSVGASDPE